VDGKASLKGAWSSQVNHLNLDGHNHIPGTADRLRRCQLSSPVSVITHKLLTVIGNVDHIHRRDLYSAARPSRRNGFYRATQLCQRGLGSRNSVRLSIRPSVRLSHGCFVTNPKNLPAIFLYHTKGQSFLSNVIFRTVVKQLTRFQLT